MTTAYTVPNEGTAYSDVLSGLDKTMFDALILGNQGSGVFVGMDVTAQGTPDMTVAIATGAGIVGTTLVVPTAGNVTITAADSTYDRVDLITIDSSGGKASVDGTAAGNPKLPAIPANRIPIAQVLVPAGIASIQNSQISSLAYILDPYAQRTLTNVTAGTDLTNSTTETALLTLSIPANFCRVGTKFGFDMYANQDATGSPPTFTQKTRWGGTSGVQLGTLLSTPVNASSQTNVTRGMITIVTLGASGTATGGFWSRTQTDGLSRANIDESQTIDTTSAKDWVYTVKWSTAAATSHYRPSMGTMYLLRY